MITGYGCSTVALQDIRESLYHHLSLIEHLAARLIVATSKLLQLADRSNDVFFTTVPVH